MTFRSWWILFLIPVVFILLAWWRVRAKPVSFRFSSKLLLSGIENSGRGKWQWIVFLLRAAVLCLVMVALAGPRILLDETKFQMEGIDIILALDASGSMSALDFEIEKQRYTRLDVVKKVVGEFISKRHSDRIGLVVFGGYAYTVCPLTIDYSWLQTNLDRVKLGLVEDGTAIGSAIASATLRLQDSNAKSKVIILLTDGLNNAGTVLPMDAASAAKAYGIKIYTIGAGAYGYAPYQVKDQYGREFLEKYPVEIDEDLLKNMAKETGGKYFRAADTEQLRKIYGEIDSLEKVKIEDKSFFKYDEAFDKFLFWALVLLILEIILRNTIFLKIP